MKTFAKLSCLLVGVAWVGCGSSEREFSDGDGGRGGTESSSSGAPSEAGDESRGGLGSAEAGANSGGTDTGGSGASTTAGTTSGGAEAAAGFPSGGGEVGEAGAPGGPVTCSESETYCAGGDSCSDLTIDASNCGQCGHDCGALAACENSRCTPAPLLTGLTYAQGLDVSAKGLFYTRNNTVQHCSNPEKCAATEQQIGAPSSASALAVTKSLATDVIAFFGRIAASDKYAGYISCPASGCGAVSLANPGPSGAVTGLLGDGADLFFQSSGSTTDPNSSSLVRLSGNADGTQGTKLTIGNRAQVSGRIAVDSSYVYYVRIDTNNVSSVVACSRTTGCGSSYVSLNTGVPTNFAAYGGKLYWQNGIQLKRCDATDPASVATITALPGAYDKDMLVDADNIYWLTGNSLLYCELPSCTGGVKTLASGLASPSSLRMAGNFLYWLIPSASGSATGGIYRIAKP